MLLSIIVPVDNEAETVDALLRRLQPAVALAGIQAEHFGFCPEVTAKLCRLGVLIREEPVPYRPRNSQQGKRILWRDTWGPHGRLGVWRVRRLSRRQAPRATGGPHTLAGCAKRAGRAIHRPAPGVIGNALAL